MGDELVTALEITVVGMALVFGAIVVLWLVMALLVRLTGERELILPRRRPAVPTAEEEMELRRRAAIAAVAVALASETESLQPHAFPLPPTAIVTAWQAVQRSRQLTQKGPRR